MKPASRVHEWRRSHDDRDDPAGGGIRRASDSRHEVRDLLDGPSWLTSMPEELIAKYFNEARLLAADLGLDFDLLMDDTGTDHQRSGLRRLETSAGVSPPGYRRSVTRLFSDHELTKLRRERDAAALPARRARRSSAAERG